MTVSPAAPLHLVVGTPCYGGAVTALYMTSMLHLQRLCLERGVVLEVKLLSGDALVTRARNSIVTAFLDSPAATHLLFIDADLGFDAQAVFRMVDFGADVVGGLYPTKSLDWAAVQRHAAAGQSDPAAAALVYVVDFLDPAKIERRGDFARARQVGTGFLMIRRGVFNRLKARFPELQYHRVHAAPDVQRGSANRYAFFEGMVDEDGFYLPEDYTFCKRWLSIGGELWVDITSRLTHVGAYQFQGDARTLFREADSRGD